jgi:RND superfamily putative drug exporter
MSALTRFVLSHKLLVVLAWLVLTFVGIASLQRATNALSTQYTAPGGEGITTSAAIVRHFGSGGTKPPVVPVLTLPAGVTVDSPGVKAQLAATLRRVGAAMPGARIASYASPVGGARSATGNRAFVSHDGRTTFGLVYAPAYLDQSSDTASVSRVEAALRGVTVDGSRFKVTGLGALSTGSGNNGGNGVMTMTMAAGLTALVVLLFVFGSALAILPLLMALVAIPTTFLAVWGLTTVAEVNFIVEFLIALIGLGVAIDYSLLIVMRWREERAKGLSNELAVVHAMETAGRSVIYSGCTVAVGLFALIVLPLAFLRSMGYGGMLIPLVTVAVVLTLLPVVLATVGPFLDWPRHKSSGRPSRVWTLWARQVVRHPWIAAAAGLLILGVLLSAARTVSLGSPRADVLSKSGQAHTGLVALERSGIGSGVLQPFELLVQGTSPAQVAARIGGVPGVRGAAAPVTWQRNGVAVVDAFPAVDGSSPAAGDALAHVRSVAHTLPGRVRVGGAIAGNADFVNAIYGNFPLMIALIVFMTFLFLVRAFRSVLLPLKAVLMNLVSVGAAWGIMVLVWQDGYGSKALWGIAATGGIDSWIPLIVFCFLFGLSMDYEVFLLSRVREEYDATGSTEQAVVEGIGRIGRLITGAALILFLSFVSMTSGPMTEVKILGTGLAAGILLDATVVRMLLVPALVILFGKWNWWLPTPVAGLLRVPQAPRHVQRRALVPVPEEIAS